MPVAALEPLKSETLPLYAPPEFGGGGVGAMLIAI